MSFSKTLKLLKWSNSCIQCRFVSNKFFKPHPRTYRRRLFEAAVKPILPPDVMAENKRLTENEVYTFFPEPDGREYSDYDLAQVAMLKEWIRDEKYRMVGICQLLYVKETPRWLAQNQFRLNGLEFKQFPRKIMKKLFEGTAFDDISSIFDDRTCVLFGKDMDCFKGFVSQSLKYNWLIPLAVTFDDRVLSIPAVEKIAKLNTPEELRTETTQILDQSIYSFLNI